MSLAIRPKAALHASARPIGRCRPDEEASTVHPLIAPLTFAATTAIASVLVRATLPKLAASFRVQAAALVIVAVPVVLSGAAISIGWCVLALALAAVGGLISDRIARGAAVIAWALALVNLALWCAGHNSEATAIWMTVRGRPISAWIIMGALIGLAGHEVALLAGWLREDNAAHRAELERFSSTFSFTASAVFAFAAIAGLPAAGATGVLIAYAWTLFLVDRLSPRLKLGAQAWAALFLAAAKWAVIDSFIRQSSPSWSAASYAPILNPLTVNAAALAASLVGMSRLRRQSLEMDKRVAVCAALVLVWAGTLEIARMIDAGLFPGSALWPHAALLQFAWTSWWMIGITGFVANATRLDRRELIATPALRNLAIVPIALGIKFLTLDTIFGHGFHPVASAVFFNAQCATGGLVLAGLIFMRWLLPNESRLAFAAAAVGVLVPLWCGTMEIERAFVCSPAIGGVFADHMLAMQVACSIFFSIYAIACVVLGFAFQTVGLRYFGLALFALTLAKVGVLDMSRASTASRFLSFIGLGGLLLVTSVVYGKLSPKLVKVDAGPKGFSSSPRPGQPENRISL